MTEPTRTEINRFVYEGCVNYEPPAVWRLLLHSMMITEWQRQLDFNHVAPRDWYTYPQDKQIIDLGHKLSYSSEAGNRYSKIVWTLTPTPGRIPFPFKFRKHRSLLDPIRDTQVHLEHIDYVQDPPSGLELRSRDGKADYAGLFARISLLLGMNNWGEDWSAPL